MPSFLDDYLGGGEPSPAPAPTASRGGGYSPGQIDSIITEAATRHGVDPKVMLALADVESSRNPNAVGPATRYGAGRGLFQIMDAFHHDYGVTDPTDPRQNADGAARMFRKNMDATGSIDGAIAAHQAGLGNVLKAGGGPTAGTDGLTTNKDYVAKVKRLAGGDIAPAADAPKAGGKSFLDDYLAYELPTKPESSGLLRRAVGDTATGLAQGLVGLPQTAMALANVATGGAAEKAGKVLRRGADVIANTVGDAISGNTVGRDFGTTGDTLTQGMNNTVSDLGTLMSPEAQAAQQAMHDNSVMAGEAASSASGGSTIAKIAGEAWGGATGMLKNPGSILPMLAASVPTMLIPAGVVGRVSAGIFERSVASAVRAGAAPEAAAAAGRAAVEKFTEGAGGIAVAALSEGVQGGGQNAQQAKGKILDMPDAEIGALQPFKDLIGQGIAPADARAQLADTVEAHAMLAGTALSSLGGTIAGRFQAKVGTRLFGGEAASAVKSMGGVKDFLQNVTANSVQEMIQSGGEQFGQNLGMRAADPNQSLAEGMGEQIGGGAVGGMFFGAGEHLGAAYAGHGAPAVRTQPAVVPVAMPGERTPMPTASQASTPQEAAALPITPVISADTIMAAHAAKRAATYVEPAAEMAPVAAHPIAQIAPIGPEAATQDAITRIAARGATQAADQSAMTEPDRLAADLKARVQAKYGDNEVPIGTDVGPTIDEAAHQAATSPTNDLPEPTPAMQAAGNHVMGHTRISGLDLSISHPDGSVRVGIDGEGRKWSRSMSAHYGYVRGTIASDGAPINAYVKPGTPTDYRGPVFVIDQRKADGSFDEHKAVIGAASPDEAKSLYDAHYPDGSNLAGAVSTMSLPAFKQWIRHGNTAQPMAAHMLGKPVTFEAVDGRNRDAASVDRVAATGEGDQLQSGAEAASGPRETGAIAAVDPAPVAEGSPVPLQPEPRATGAAALTPADHAAWWKSSNEGDRQQVLRSLGADESYATRRWTLVPTGLRERIGAERSAVPTVADAPVATAQTKPATSVAPTAEAALAPSTVEPTVAAPPVHEHFDRTELKSSGYDALDSREAAAMDAMIDASLSGTGESSPMSDTLRGFGFAEEEVSDAVREAAQGGSEGQAREAVSGQPQEGGSGVRQAYVLTSESQADGEARLTREAAQRKSDAEAAKRADAPDARDFTLSGSDRAVDEAAARGQQSLLDSRTPRNNPLDARIANGRLRFEQYDHLGESTSTPEQAFSDASRITGLSLKTLGVTVVTGPTDMRDDVPMRFGSDTRTIEINPNLSMSRADAAQYAAEELLHAADILDGQSIAASSTRLALGGDVRNEIEAHVASRDTYGAFFAYPVLEKALGEGRIKAELFARMGALYLGEPELMRRSLPKAYEAFHEIFEGRNLPASDGVRGKLWSDAGGPVQAGRRSGDGGRTAREVQGRSGGERSGLEKFRSESARVLRGSDQGTRVEGSLESRALEALTRVASGAQADNWTPIARKGHDLVFDTLSKGTHFSLWARTIGTQLGKARTTPAYKAVFDRSQKFLDDITKVALRAEGLAPTILPKVGGLSDVPTAVKQAFGRGGMSTADNEWLGRALADGTLAGKDDGEGPSPLNGKVFTEAELRERGATDTQVAIYREARAAIDQSLEDSGRGTMLSMLRAAKVEQAVLDQIDLGAQTMDDVIAWAQDNIAGRMDGARADAEARLGDMQAEHDRAMEAEIAKTTMPSARLAVRERYAQEATSFRDEAFREVDAATTLMDNLQGVADKAKQLQAAGYAPLSRFGRYFLTAYEGDRVQFFRRYESLTERNREQRAMQDQNPGWTFADGEMSQDEHKQFQGVDPSVMALFAKEAGLENDAFQKWYEMATAERSAMKRLIHRKGTAGYSLDARRSLSSFVTSNARFASSAVNVAAIGTAVAAIQDGGVKDEAIALQQYVTNPVEEAAALRGFMFSHFLGASIASGLINLTQPVLMTYPYLAGYGPAKAAKAMKEALAATVSSMRDKVVSNPELAKAIDRAKADGIVDPSEIHSLMAASRGAFKTPTQQAWQTVIGANFALTEAFNRKVTFSAAYLLAQRAGEADPYASAKKAVYDTQGLYSRANRPNWARGAVGATLFTFKQFSIAYIEFLQQLAREGKMPKTQLAIALGILVLASGTQGLPGSDDLDDVIDALGQSLGFGTNVRQTKRKLFEAALGETLGNAAMYGISTQLGADFQGRLSMGNLVPGTAALIPSNRNKGKDIAEWAGPLGSLITNGASAMQDLLGGNFGSALASMSSTAGRNIAQGTHMLVTGEAADSRGRKIRDVTAGEAIGKVIGFNPQRIASESRAITEIKRDEDIVTMESGKIKEQWAAGIAHGDKDAIDEARARLREWNGDNPDMKIDPTKTFRAVMQRVTDIKRSRADRTKRSVPTSMRADAADRLSQ